MAVLIMVQKGVVLASKFVRLLSVVPASSLVEVWPILTRSDSSMHPGTPTDVDGELKKYVLHLPGEEDLVKLIAKTERKDTERWTEKGRSKPPKALFHLIKSHSTSSQGFKEVFAFDSSGDPPLGPEEPPNCWALPLVTLAAIVVALPRFDKGEADLVRLAVREGLRFVRLVERNLDETGLVNMRSAAEVVWLSVDVYERWLDRDLRRVAPRLSGDGREIVEAASRIAKQEVMDFLRKHQTEPEVKMDVLSWPERVLAANCMYRVCASILRGYEDGKYQTVDELFVWLRTAIADVLGACLTNLARALYLECFSHRVEAREKCVRDAVLALGETEDILEFLGTPQVTAHFPTSTQYIDDWKREGQTSA